MLLFNSTSPSLTSLFATFSTPSGSSVLSSWLLPLKPSSTSAITSKAIVCQRIFLFSLRQRARLAKASTPPTSWRFLELINLSGRCCYLCMVLYVAFLLSSGMCAYSSLQIYASACAALPSMAKTGADSSITADGTLILPVVHLQLPSLEAFPLLHSWITCPSPAALLQHVMPALPAASPSSIHSLTSPTQASIASRLAVLPRNTLLSKVSLVHQLWQDTCALSVADAKLWDTMGMAWDMLVGALALQLSAEEEEMKC